MYLYAMASYVVSARKYRPATFDTVVGQASITSTLKNAIRTNHLAQAFLFCGPRGVGKTTCARILAKTINCENITSNIEACNACESCKSFNQSHSFNVHELDAASNNTIEGIRTLIDQVRIPPQVGNYKVYIIDEVHMLSQQAFNAFLKTLEEPPAYAKFILATTEKHKIIPTILSRCQIFDFSRITVKDIAAQLRFVAEHEGVEADPNALHIIAQKADGAMRDALTIFDQIVSFSGNTVSYQQVIDNLNVLDYDYFFRLTDLILHEKPREILLLVNDILMKGFEGADFIAGFGSHMRDLLMCKDPLTVKLIEVGEDIRKKYLEQSAKCPEELLMGALAIINHADVQYKSTSNKRLLLELSLLQTASLVKKKAHKSAVTPVRELIAPPPAEKGETPQPEQKQKDTTKESPKPDFPETENASKAQTLSGEQIQEPVRQSTGKRTGQDIPMGRISLKIKPSEDKTDEVETDDEYLSENGPVSSFTQSEFLQAWTNFAEKRKEESLGLYLAMTKHKPRVLKDGIIQISLDNAIQEDTLQERKPELLTYLRKELNNYSISIQTRIRKSDQTQKAYLPKEKLEKLVEKNPHLETLKRDLGLDLIY